MKKLRIRQLLREAASASKQAHAPYSKYRVGAALVTSRCRIFRGCNVENASYGLTLCAERVAISAAVAAGCRKFTAMAIVSNGGRLPYPCGACRQVLAEFCASNFPIYVASSKRIRTFRKTLLGALLPNAFGLL